MKWITLTLLCSLCACRDERIETRLHIPIVTLGINEAAIFNAAKTNAEALGYRVAAVTNEIGQIVMEFTK